MNTFKEQLINILKEKYKDSIEFTKNVNNIEVLVKKYFKNLKNELKDVCDSSNGKVKIGLDENDEKENIIARITIERISLCLKKEDTCIKGYYIDKQKIPENNLNSTTNNYIPIDNDHIDFWWNPAEINENTISDKIDVFLKKAFEKIVDVKNI